MISEIWGVAFISEVVPITANGSFPYKTSTSGYISVQILFYSVDCFNSDKRKGFFFYFTHLFLRTWNFYNSWLLIQDYKSSI